jgi:predicted nuclease of predicted toxin-antitoxin system
MALREEGHDVIHVADALSQGSDDSAVWNLAFREDRILVTFDKDFPLGDPKLPGLILIRAFREPEQPH